MKELRDLRERHSVRRPEPVFLSQAKGPRNKTILLDSHVHTVFSDGAATISDVEKICFSKNIGCCITDHNEIRGSINMLDRQRVPTMPAVEMGSQERIEVIVYFHRAEACEKFFRKHIEPFRKKRFYAFLPRSLDYLMAAISEHEVIVSIPHPFAPLWKNIEHGKGRRDVIERTLSRADCIEVYNGTLTPRANRRALDLCASLYRIPLGGSDSHQVETIGSVVVGFRQPITSDNLFDAIMEDKIFGILGEDIRTKYVSNTWRLIGRHSRKFISASDSPHTPEHHKFFPGLRRSVKRKAMGG